MDKVTGAIVDECIHGLTAAWCGVCKDRDRAKRKQQVEARNGFADLVEDINRPRGPRVVAKFDGQCGQCGDETVEGEDWVYLRNGVWVCEGCAGAMDDAEGRRGWN